MSLNLYRRMVLEIYLYKVSVFLGKHFSNDNFEYLTITDEILYYRHKFAVGNENTLREIKTKYKNYNEFLRRIQ